MPSSSRAHLVLVFKPWQPTLNSTEAEGQGAKEEDVIISEHVGS
jgi:hypothetical protein